VRCFGAGAELGVGADFRRGRGDWPGPGGERLVEVEGGGRGAFGGAGVDGGGCGEEKSVKGVKEGQGRDKHLEFFFNLAVLAIVLAVGVGVG